jgi:hypothetical protein
MDDKEKTNKDKKLAKRAKVFEKQRINRGFDDSETWCLDVVIARFVLPRLKRFKEVNCAYPCYSTPEQWDSELDEMIETFEILAKDEWPEERISQQLDKIESGLQLFARRFRQINW